MTETVAKTLLRGEGGESEGSVDETKPYIVKFQKSKRDATYSYQGWAEKQKYVPKDFNISDVLNKIEEIFLPVWLFEVSAETSWHGEVSHTESRSRTRYNYMEERDEHYEEDEDVWEPVSSTHHGSYLIPISASRMIEQKEIDALKGKQFDLHKYNESHLEGRKVYASDIDKTTAKGICEKRIKDLEKQACKRQVERLNGCSSKLTYKESYKVLLPVFTLSYTYNGTFYHNLIDGMTGDVQGNMPVNMGKKVAFTFAKVVGVIAAILVILMIIGFLGNR